MELRSYDIIRSEDGEEFFFYSEGPNGRIKKAIRFHRIDTLSMNTFNLAFGDWVEASQRLDDRSVSNNNDRLQILITVAKVVTEFMESNPSAIIWVVGSTPSRIRLYQMAISSFWPLINQQFELHGKTGGDWMPFRQGINYDEFLFFKKIP